MTVSQDPKYIPKYPPTILRSTRFHQATFGFRLRTACQDKSVEMCRKQMQMRLELEIFWGNPGEVNWRKFGFFVSSWIFHSQLDVGSRWRSSVENCLGYLGLMFPKSLTKCAKNNCCSKLEGRDFGAIFPSHFGLEHLGVYIGIPGGFPKINPQIIQVIFPGWWFGTWIWFSMIYMGCHPSHWRTHVFQDGYCTTNQISIEYWSLWWLADPWRTRSIDRLGDCSASGAMRWCEGVEDKHGLYMGLWRFIWVHMGL